MFLYLAVLPEITSVLPELLRGERSAHGRKNPTTYQFSVTVEGKTFEIDVPRSHYDYYEVGDTYYIYRYDGALGQPFYLSYAYVD